VLAGLAVVGAPYLWVLTDLWNSSPSLLRTASPDGFASNFYDLQARAMLHGHLYITNGALGDEAFIHAGRQYTYFGLFPSLLRIPILLVTHSLDGRLTAFSMLMAWLVTALFSSLLVWRVRTLTVGLVSLSRTEAATYAVLVATIVGGSVLVFLASDPWVFSEDLAWSVALTVGTLFALIGVLERPSPVRVVGCGLLVLAANLTRATTGYACVIGVILVGLWLATGRAGAERRRWAVPVLLAGLVPLAAGCVIDYVKFGILIGLPESDQVAYALFDLSHVGNGSYFNAHFIPTSLLAYFQPTGLRLSRIFPFITLPSFPATDVGGVAGFGSDRVASVPASMPLLLAGALWGTLVTFRPATSRGLRLLRIPLFAAGAAAATVMIYGWTENRFTADFMPWLILGSVIGLIDVCRQVRTRPQRAQRLIFVVVAVLGVYGIVANVAMASTYQDVWSSSQVVHFVQAQRSVARLTGQSLTGEIDRGRSLPTSGPGDELFIADDCAGLYITQGQLPLTATSVVATRLLQRVTWHPVELEASDVAVAAVRVHGPLGHLGSGVTLASIGPHGASTVVLQPFGVNQVILALKSASPTQYGSPFRLHGTLTNFVLVSFDPQLQMVSVTSQQNSLLTANLSGTGPVVIHSIGATGRQYGQPIAVRDVPGDPLATSLCRRLLP
jgi:hypothetical protein